MRATSIKKGALDLDSIFSPGYSLDTDGRIVAGYKWEMYNPPMNANSNSVTIFTLPTQAKVADNLLLVQMYVNGIKVESSLLSLNQQTPTELIFDDTDYVVVSTDDVEIWYVTSS